MGSADGRFDELDARSLVAQTSIVVLCLVTARNLFHSAFLTASDSINELTMFEDGRKFFFLNYFVAVSMRLPLGLLRLISRHI